MRFKIDENLPAEVAELLEASKHDAMTIFDQHMVGELDPKVASVYKSEDRALITLDLDLVGIQHGKSLVRVSISGDSSLEQFIHPHD
jgi:predicted nuclease of predicted toxin-antitoxin system